MKKVEKQVAAFDQVLGLCNALGEMYNPSKESMKVAAMNSLLTSAKVSVKAVDKAKSHLILVINNRQDSFAPLPLIATRIVHSLTAADAPPSLIADMKLYRDKFRSQAKVSQAPKVPPDDSSKVQPIPARTPRGPISALDYNSKISNFGMMIQMLQDYDAYTPNETDISIEGLTFLLDSLKEKHQAVQDAQLSLYQARVFRDMIVFGDNGIRGTAKRVKRYVSSVYGFKSIEARKIYSIKFKSK